MPAESSSRGPFTVHVTVYSSSSLTKILGVELIADKSNVPWGVVHMLLMLVLSYICR